MMTSMFEFVGRMLKVIEIQCPEGYQKVWVDGGLGLGSPTAVLGDFVLQCGGSTPVVRVRYPDTVHSTVILEFARSGDIHECRLPAEVEFADLKDAVDRFLVLHDMAEL